jgi:PAS domain S-box-containing protein
MAKILIVDDEPGSRFVCGALLGDAGHEVLEAADGRDGFQRALESKPDLIISDILMPVMDGFELLRSVRAAPEIAATRFVFLTGAYQREEAEALARAGGVLEILWKPFEPAELVKAAARVLQMKAGPITLPAPAGEFEREHFRVLTAKLSAKVAELEATNLSLRVEVEARRKAEGKARLQRQLLDSVGEAIIATDLEGRVIYWNRFAELLYGWSAEETLGQDILKLTVPEQWQDTAKAIMDQVIAGDRWSGEGHVWRRDGSSFPAAITDTLIRDENGHALGVVGVSKDITERERMQRELRDSEERFRLLVNGVRDYAIIMLDPAGCVVSWNPGAERIIGYPAEEILGREFACFYPPKTSRPACPAPACGRPRKPAKRSMKAGACARTDHAFSPM